MSHHLEYITDHALSALTVANETGVQRTTREGRITKLGGVHGRNGVRIRTRRLGAERQVLEQTHVDVRGEDLYALREFLAELPEEAFVRPADPVKKPERWTDGDIVEETRPGTDMFWVWVRKNGAWRTPGGLAVPTDEKMEQYLYNPSASHGDVFTVLRQASGQDAALEAQIGDAMRAAAARL